MASLYQLKFSECAFTMLHASYPLTAGPVSISWDLPPLGPGRADIHPFHPHPGAVITVLCLCWAVLLGNTSEKGGLACQTDSFALWFQSEWGEAQGLFPCGQSFSGSRGIRGVGPAHSGRMQTYLDEAIKAVHLPSTKAE